MDWTSILQQLFELCIVPLLGLATTYLVKYLKAKSEESAANKDESLLNKYKSILLETAATCLQATNQTYVDSLKEANAFDVNAQIEAFSKTKQAIYNALTEEATNYLETAYGDLDQVIDNLIEAGVKESK